MRMELNDTTLICGAGFSSNYGIPTTRELMNQFTTFAPSDATTDLIQAEISKQLVKFWDKVFGVSKSEFTPSFEQHFTTIDLAANSGHNLGPFYTPSRIRAIRRFSIHRVFDILDSNYDHFDYIKQFFIEVSKGSNNSILTTNWDIGIEKHFEFGNLKYNYGIEIEPVNTSSRNYEFDGTEILKLHGSANWVYCDSCRRLFYYHPNQEGKGALHNWTFLEKRDFNNLSTKLNINDEFIHRDPSKCKYCDIRLAARIATFSFEKLLGFDHFQSIWQKALFKLRASKKWVFIGYSLPEADYELRQLLKIAQLEPATF